MPFPDFEDARVDSLMRELDTAHKLLIQAIEPGDESEQFSVLMAYNSVSDRIHTEVLAIVDHPDTEAELHKYGEYNRALARAHQEYLANLTAEE